MYRKLYSILQLIHMYNIKSCQCVVIFIQITIIIMHIHTLQYIHVHVLCTRILYVHYTYTCTCIRNSCMPVCVMQLFCHLKYSILYGALMIFVVGSGQE